MVIILCLVSLNEWFTFLFYATLNRYLFGWVLYRHVLNIWSRAQEYALTCCSMVHAQNSLSSVFQAKIQATIPLLLISSWTPGPTLFRIVFCCWIHFNIQPCSLQHQWQSFLEFPWRNLSFISKYCLLGYTRLLYEILRTAILVVLRRPHLNTSGVAGKSREMGVIPVPSNVIKKCTLICGA